MLLLIFIHFVPDPVTKNEEQPSVIKTTFFLLQKPNAAGKESSTVEHLY